MTDISHKHTPEQKYEVTPLELFFDLVFAFALSQLSPHLATHLSWRSAAETVVMLPGGGPILFLAARGWYLWAVPMVRSQLHLIGGVVLLFVGLATQTAPPYVVHCFLSVSAFRRSRYLTDSDTGYTAL